MSNSDRSDNFSFTKSAPFILLLFTNVISAYGTVQVLKTDILYINKTLERHDKEIILMRSLKGVVYVAETN